MAKILNAYAGVGGNARDWGDHEVTAIELNPKIAAVYQRLNPTHTVIITDAHEYIRAHHAEFDIIWSSPKCQTHTKMCLFTRHKNRKYPDMELYEEILFLKHYFKGQWIVENVVPFYEPLIKPSNQVGRHCFWGNFDFDVEDVKRPANFINMANLAGKKALMEWLGIYYEENIYYEGNHCPAQVLRNCVHPKIGKQILDYALAC